MYFLFFILHGWRKRSAVQPKTICSEIPRILVIINRFFPGVNGLYSPSWAASHCSIKSLSRFSASSFWEIRRVSSW